MPTLLKTGTLERKLNDLLFSFCRNTWTQSRHGGEKKGEGVTVSVCACARLRAKAGLCVIPGRLVWTVTLAGWPTPISPSRSALTGWHTAVLHWQALCSCAHTKAASWRTALVSPTPDNLRRGSGWRWGEGEGLRKVLFHTLGIQNGTLDPAVVYILC